MRASIPVLTPLSSPPLSPRAVVLNANRHVTGTLRGFDQFMNLVLDSTVDVKNKQDIGMVVGGAGRVLHTEASGVVRAWRAVGAGQLLLSVSTAHQGSRAERCAAGAGCEHGGGSSRSTGSRVVSSASPPPCPLAVQVVRGASIITIEALEFIPL